MADSNARAARLASVKKSTSEWADKYRTNLKNKAARCRLILKGRTGSERLASSLTTATAAAVDEEISSFLES